MRRGNFPSQQQIALTGVLYACDPTRLQIVRALDVKGEQTCCAFHLPIAKSTLAHHLRVLRDAGAIRTRTEGTQSFNSLRREDLDVRFPGLLDAILRSVSREKISQHGGVGAE